jgi:hypothetical protein
MYDFLSTITADYSATLTIHAQGTVTEESQGNQVIHLGADGSEERISFNTNSIFFISFAWNILSEADSGTVFDWYNDPAKANKMQRSFKYAHGDGHTYVVRFDCKLTRAGKAVWSYGLPGIRMKVLGRIAD